MRRRLIIAMGIGALISAAFFAVPEGWLSPAMRELWQLLGAPGIIAIMLIWGPHSGPSPEILAYVVMWAVSAIVYGLVAFAALSVFKISN